MDANELYDKMKNYFPQAVAISVDCGKQTRNDGTDFNNYSVRALSTPIGDDSVTIAYGYGYTPEEALMAAAKYFGKFEAEKVSAMGETVDYPVFEDTEAGAWAASGTPD